MKRLLFSCAIVLALAAGGGYVYKASADSPGSPPPGAQGAGLADHPPGPWGGGWGHGPGPQGPEFGFAGPGARPDPGPGGGPWGHHGDGRDPFSLFAQVPNKGLSSGDVKIIASAILLEHGNHLWSVTNVAAQSDKSIDFSFASPHGDVIATFAVDPATGHIKRVS